MRTAPWVGTILAPRRGNHHRPSSIVTVSVALLALLFATATTASSTFAPSTPGDSNAAPFGFRTVASEGTSVLNVDTGLTFASIQDAINAATAGDTLRVLAPVLVEGQVMVDRDINLEGATGAEVVAMGVDTGEVGDDRAWFLVDTGVTMNVSNLTFDGNGFLVFQAFRHRGDAGLFEAVNFRDIQYSTVSAEYHGTAIVAFGGDVDVIDSTFEDIGRIGVLHFGAGITASNITNSTYVGKGDGDHLDYAWEAGAGAVVRIDGSVASDCRGIAAADNSSSAGMLATTFFGAGTAVEVVGSTFLDSAIGIGMGTGDPADTAGAILNFNRIFGNDIGVQHTTMASIDAENNWWGCNDGPGAAGCDDVQGSGGPVDADPWLLLSVAVDDPVVLYGATTTAFAALTGNSEGVDTGGLGWVTDDTPAAFASDVGTMTPDVTGTLQGIAASEFFAEVHGDGVVQATVDNQTVETPIRVVATVEVPTLGNFGLLLLVSVLLVLGVRRLNLS